jgi:hypothetical protein
MQIIWRFPVPPVWKAVCLVQNDSPPPENTTDERLLAARQKLRAALDGLDAAISRRAEQDMEHADRGAEFALLQDDRARLAQELDAALARMRALESASGEVARRVERASAAVRAVIGSTERQED